MQQGVITPDHPEYPDCTDWTVQEPPVWLTVGDLFSVFISYHEGRSLVVEVYPKGAEDMFCLGSVEVEKQEAEQALADYRQQYADH